MNISKPLRSRPPRIASTVPADEAVRVPLLRRPARPRVRRPRHVAAVRELRRRPTSSTRWSRSTRCTSASATAASWCSSTSTSSAEDIFTEYAYFSSYSDSLGRSTPSDYVDAMIDAPRARARQLRRRDGQQRRLPAAVLRRARHPVPRHRAGGERRRGGRGEGRADRRVAFFGARAGPTSWPPRASRADLHARQQRARPRARPQRLRRRHDDRCSSPTAW